MGLCWGLEAPVGTLGIGGASSVAGRPAGGEHSTNHGQLHGTTTIVLSSPSVFVLMVTGFSVLWTIFQNIQWALQTLCFEYFLVDCTVTIVIQFFFWLPLLNPLILYIFASSFNVSTSVLTRA